MNEPAASPAVALRGVRRTYGEVTALDQIDLEVAVGQAVALMGPSGAGKSTLLQLVGAMDQPDAGEIWADGQRIDTLRRGRLVTYRRRIGFVFQHFHLLPTLTALDNVLAPILPLRVGFDKRARARELLDQVGLAGRAGALPGRLSGGEQQRVAIARALIGKPRLLLADEPTGDLDSATGREIVDLVLSLRADYDMTMLFATHNPEVTATCDRVIRLHDGRVVSDDPIRPGDGIVERIGRLRA